MLGRRVFSAALVSVAFVMSALSAPAVKAIAAGASHGLALLSDGTVWAWGHNDHGQLGDGTYKDRPVPVQVNGLADTVAIAAGQIHSLALKKDGTVWVWGSTGLGEYAPTPVR